MRPLLSVVLPVSLLGALMLPSVGHAQCFSSRGSTLWPSHEVVYEIHRSALGDAADTSCLDADLIDAYDTYADDNGIVTIDDWFLEGLEDWLSGDPDIDQPLTYRERVGDETPYVLVTSLCDLGGESFSSSVSIRDDIPGRVGEDVRTLNLRPKTADPARFAQTVRHELGHVFGMQHAQSRPDRDQYVLIHPDAGPGYDLWSAADCKNTLYNLPFDYSSIMIYPPRPTTEDGTCEAGDQTDCEMVPISDDLVHTSWHAMDNRTITAADRWALRLHYARQQPSRVGLFNPTTSMYAMARMYPHSVTDGNAYAIGDADADSAVTDNFQTFNGVFDVDLSNSTAVMVAGDWLDAEADGADFLGVLALERDATGRLLRVQRDTDEDMEGDDEVPDLIGLSGAVMAFVGNFDGDEDTPPTVGLYSADLDELSYDLDGDDEIDTSVTSFFTGDFAPWPVAADLGNIGRDGLCLFYRDLGIFICDTDGDDEADFGTVFTDRLGDHVYPVVGDWNGDGIDDLGIYDADERVFALDRDMDHTISAQDAHGLSMDLIFSPEGAAPAPGDVSLVPFAARLDADQLSAFASGQPVWEDEWCDTIDGELVCDDPWVTCWSLKAISGGKHSGPVCTNTLTDIFDELPENCAWDGFLPWCF